MQCQTVVPERILKKIIETRSYFGVGKEFKLLQNYRIGGVKGGEPEFFFSIKVFKI